ncbi:MAG: succinate dehydrogenase cytochrome b subunit [Acidimicrobiia bacterium]|nr:succinate dehydrogenase cytochrome b subunit [Acidimicrobiia bacterium]
MNRRAKRTTFPLVDLYQTAVGKKWVMAVTGIALMGFVFAHMFGNLKLYQGPEDLDKYAAGLKTLGDPILPNSMVVWLLRVGLLVVFALHIHSAYSLTMMNRRSNGAGGGTRRDTIAANFAARTMRWTGIIVAAFLVWHLADFTWGWSFVNPDYQYGAVYDNVVASFSRPAVAIAYVVANLALGVHLYHGSWSIFQSLGSMSPRFNPRRNPLRRGFALAFTAAVVLPNISFPIAVQLGIIG